LLLLLQRLARGVADVPELWEEVIRAREGTATMEAACATAMHATEASAQVAAVARESVTALVKEVEDRATLDERDAGRGCR
jgi:hypothetical protein